MDGMRLNSLIYKGRGKAADHIGAPCKVYRPVTAAAPFTNLVGQLNAAFNSGDSNYLHANEYNDPIWYADYDGRQTLPGDYMVRNFDQNVWFVGAQQQLLPIMVIECNAWIRIMRMAPSGSFGAEGYSGIIQPSPVLGTPDSMWPCSIMIGGRSLASIGLPASVKEGGWRVLLPPGLPLIIEAGDLMQDNLGRTFAVESAEFSDLGWRLVCNETHS